MKLRLLIVAVMAAVLVIPSYAFAAETTGTISGSVHGESGSPIANATVIASGPVSRQSIA